ncbi:hypothetical protein D3C75_732820 [compost metagenome]
MRIGTQLGPRASRAAFVIHQTAEIELAETGMRGTEFDKLMFPPVVHQQGIFRGGEQDIALMVGLCDVVGMPGIVHHMGDVGPVNVAAFKRHHHAGSLQQRPVKTVLPSGVRFRQSNPAALKPLLPFSLVQVKADTVASLGINVGVAVIILG